MGESDRCGSCGERPENCICVEVEDDAETFIEMFEKVEPDLRYCQCGTMLKEPMEVICDSCLDRMVVMGEEW